MQAELCNMLTRRVLLLILIEWSAGRTRLALERGSFILGHLLGRRQKGCLLPGEEMYIRPLIRASPHEKDDTHF